MTDRGRPYRDEGTLADTPQWRLAVNGRNLTNAHYIEQPFNPFNNMPGAPLAVLATLTAKY